MSFLSASTLGDDPHSHLGFHVLHPEIRQGYQSSSLSVASLDINDFDFSVNVSEYYTPAPSTCASRAQKNMIMEVVSASLLITANTVGVGATILPDVAAGPGMAMSTALLTGIYGINLISGLLLAEVGIRQHEASGGDVPSSFKEFAEVTLQSSVAANMVAVTSMFINSCVLAFSLNRSGELAASHLPDILNLAEGLDPTMCSASAACAVVALVASQTNQSLSRVTSAAVAVLFASFAGLLLPGLASVQDPVGTFFAPGTSSSGDIGFALTTTAPIFLTTMIYQNIVPSVTKLLNYDRTSTTAAITLGSMVPLVMYSSFNLAVLGGGIDASVASSSPLMTIFATAALVGSCITIVMSLSEEFENVFFKNTEKVSAEQQTQEGTTFSLPTVLLAMVAPLVGGAILDGSDVTASLDLAGSYGSPLLYGILPVVMAYMQRTRDEAKEQDSFSKVGKDIVPGGFGTLVLLGGSTVGYLAMNFSG